ncbi:MAG TPA: hypothetical protein V6C95_16235 [Coleofasciculaceae cyanobacterium]
MNKLVAATLLTFATVPTYLVFPEKVFADTQTVCYPVTQAQVIQNPADHPNAYADGYSEGRQSARKGETYRPRTAGGEFGRGYNDGYYGRDFTGQEYSVANRVEYYTSQQCNTYTTHNNHHRDLDRDELRYRINRIYQEELGRDADRDGLRTYQRAYQRGWSFEQIRRDIANSEEGRNQRGR